MRMARRLLLCLRLSSKPTNRQKKEEVVCMTHSGSKRNLVGILTVALLLVIAVPATSFGKDRGRRGRGRDFDNRKCGKFINCHDARDGRWDGRGPRRNFSRWVWRNNRRDNDGWRWERRRDNRTRDSRWWSRDNRFRDINWRNRRNDNRWRDDRFRNNDLRDRITRRFQYRDRWR